MEYVLAELRAGQRGSDDRGELLHAIGALSPPSYWEVAAEFATGAEAPLRLEAAVALEGLAAPESLKAIQNALNKEDHPEIEKEWIRALAAAGSTDPRVRKELLKRRAIEKDELLRLNTIVALGSLAPGEDVAEVLRATLRTGSAPERAAAACAMAISRDPAWLADLDAVAAESPDAAVDEACAAAGEIAAAGRPPRDPRRAEEVAKDAVQRDRWFGFAP
jgi:HEAT repeat protein